MSCLSWFDWSGILYQKEAVSESPLRASVKRELTQRLLPINLCCCTRQ